MSLSIERLKIKCSECSAEREAKSYFIEHQHCIQCKKCGYQWLIKFTPINSDQQAAYTKLSAFKLGSYGEDPKNKQLAVYDAKIGCPECKKFGPSDILFDGEHFYIRHKNCGFVWLLSFEPLGKRGRGGGGPLGPGGAPTPGSESGPGGGPAGAT